MRISRRMWRAAAAIPNTSRSPNSSTPLPPRPRPRPRTNGREINKLPLEIDALSLLSEALNFDFARKGMDEAFTDGEIAEMSGLQGIRDRVVRVSGKKNPTVREFIQISGRGRVHNPIVGGPKEVADRLEQWFVERACDGFVVSATHVPGAYEDFVRFVVPELQRRGLFRKGFAGTDLARQPRDTGAADRRMAPHARTGAVSDQPIWRQRRQHPKNCSQKSGTY